MKIAITGKGGVGKTTFAATLARLYAEEGKTVLAADVAMALRERGYRHLINPQVIHADCHAHNINDRVNRTYFMEVNLLYRQPMCL